MSDMHKQILEDLGYKLVDCGNHWRTSALYRGGDNSTAIQIYKDSGVWTDYVTEGGHKPLKQLIQLTLRDNPKKLKSVLKSIDSEPDALMQSKPKTLIEMDKVYDQSILEKLFPNYTFYSKKKISESTQKLFKVGLAGSGNMYRRMVFPIYNEHSQIIGFSGRKVDSNNGAKWKHIGKKNNWIYPAYVPNKETVDSIIDDTGEVYLVESIGDAMALYDQGIKNVLVIFGLSVSSSIISYLSGKAINKIIIAGNNDFNSEVNRGLMASIKNYLKLSSYFDLDVLSIKVPPKGFNDLGDAHQSGSDLLAWSKISNDVTKQRQFISDFVSKHDQNFSQAHKKKAKKINE
ncbi:MAG: hypothetical protein HWN81_02110 [Candidatus Lokiarchaeota archaeon]|nr:hypothetical protein [Candidatus Lokiarchaeota archaeon]